MSFTPLFFGARIPIQEEIRKTIDQAAALYKETGKMPSRPGCGSIVGYDYGLMLYSLTLTNNQLAEEIYCKMMQVRDDSGAWVEMYLEGKPHNTRCRPWESGINLYVALCFAEIYK